jgi:hypothetical protein
LFLPTPLDHSRLILGLTLISLALLAGENRAAAASCHAPERPVLGLISFADSTQTPGVDVVAPRSLRQRSCPADAAEHRGRISLTSQYLAQELRLQPVPVLLAFITLEAEPGWPANPASHPLERPPRKRATF